MKIRYKSFYSQYGKRIFDVLMSLILLVILFIIIIIIAFSILIIMGSPVIFRQRRPGKNEKIFTVYKFRTMTNKKDAEGNLLEDKCRLTKFGKVLRRLSLDELPQIFNVLKGDLSFVGPRPLLVEYLPLYDDIQRKRHSVKPGITGWAQINGRNKITWNERFQLDCWYVKNLSFSLDCRILYYTVIKVFNRNDISSDTSVTMEKFKGNQ